MNLAFIDFPVDMDKPVAELRHVLQPIGELLLQRPRLIHNTKCVGIVLRDAKAVLGYHVISDVNAGFDGHDKMVFSAGDLVRVGEKDVFGTRLEPLELSHGSIHLRNAPQQPLRIEAGHVQPLRGNVCGTAQNRNIP